MITSGQAQKIAGPPTPKATAWFVNVPVETLM
jgi:hypothetical protein